ncbi:MAG: endonuclease [Deltaproteobacteria bacterium]
MTRGSSSFLVLAAFALVSCSGIEDPPEPTTERDGGASDAGTPDAGPHDAGPHDAGARDGGPRPDPCTFDTTAEDALYADALELEGAALRAALHDLVTDGARGFGYDAARNLMYGITGSVDVDEDNLVTCVYTAQQVEADGTRSPGMGQDIITTEHSWPRSDGAENFPAEGDLHHLFPAIAHANGTRGVHEFGDVACGDAGEAACTWSGGGSHLGPGEDARTEVFEVRAETRGDIARAHFYFAVRYELPIPAGEEGTLRRWHCEDPPSDGERARNGRIATHQNNRNPFVDQPQLVERIADF